MIADDGSETRDTTKACAECGELFTTGETWRHRRRLYCSGACQRRSQDATLESDVPRSLRKRAYGRWYRMIDRCENPANSHWSRYGGRGIYVCPEWHDFETYYAAIGDAPDGMTLDRIDNNGPYAPDNVRWATPTQQRANQEYDHMAIRDVCKNGHAFDEENTHIDRRGWRSCRACGRAKRARQRAAKRGA